MFTDVMSTTVMACWISALAPLTLSFGDETATSKPSKSNFKLLRAALEPPRCSH